MMTFEHRDRRLGVVGHAIDALDQQIADLQLDIAAEADLAQRLVLQGRLAGAQALHADLDGERTQLTQDRFDVSDEHGAALARDFLWETTAGLLPLVEADPAIVATGQPPLLTGDVAAAIEALPRGGPAPRPGFLDEIATAGADANSVDQLVGFALGHWLRQPEPRGSPFRDIGVMLPLRLETLFEERQGGWTVLLRVVPDEASIRRDQTSVTPMEAEFLAEFWGRSKVMGAAPGTDPVEWLLHPEGVVAWEQLSSRLTPPRAAWLVTTFPAALQDGAFVAAIPQDRIGRPLPERIGGLPRELVVTVVDNNQQAMDIGVLQPNLPVDEFKVPAGDDAFDSWLISWPRAQAVGMGGEFTLPPGVTPETIAALYVYGIGDEAPAEHFRAHVDAGQMALVRLGAPTNTIQGTPAADLALDNESWRVIAGRRLAGETGAGVRELAEALCGDSGALPYLAGSSHDVEDSTLLLRTLWPVLWGHYFRDVWNGGNEALVLWRWALEVLHVEGPLLPLRIGAQPYGVLPVTSLRNWQASDGGDFERIEEKIIKGLSTLVPAWADAATRRGTIVGADTRGLLGHLARPGVSARYSYRSFVAAEQLAHAYPRVPHADFMQMAEKFWEPASEVLQHRASRPYLAAGHLAQLRLPLLGSRRLLPPQLTLTDMVKDLYQIEADQFASVFYGRTLGGIVPQSLLVRLVIQSVLLAKAWYMQSVHHINGPLQNPLIWDDPEVLTPIEVLQTSFSDSEQAGLGEDLIRKLMQLHREDVFRLVSELDQHLVKDRDPLNPESGEPVNQLKLPPERHAELERILRATLDSAGHRIDSFATAIAWRRLRQHATGGRDRHRLGAYGWVDGPFLGKPGPTRAGRLHAPSHAQALTSIILRDKYLSSNDELTADGRNIWKMDLSSISVRLAVEMADEVRMGFHIFEVVGRRVEGVVGRPDRVRTLRQAKPLRPEKPDTRDSCHGIDALDGLLAGAIPGVLSDDAAEHGRQLEQLRNLKSALEAYSDLLVAEGVHQVVTGHADLAADAMDAAAGFGRPPAFEFVHTPPSGYRLGTSVLAVFPHRIPDAGGSPLELADASLAGLLGSRFGDPAQWSWTATREENGVEQTETVALADLGLTPLETVFISEDFMAEIVRSKAHQPDARITAPPAHRLIRQLGGTLGASPASISDVALQQEVPNDVLQPFEQTMRTELADRYEALCNALAAFIAETEAAGLTDAQRIAWLRRALAWGIVGPAGSTPRNIVAAILFGDLVPTPDVLAGLVTSAKDALNGRLSHAPDIADPETRKLSPVKLARAIGDVVAPGGRLAVTAKWSTQALRDAAALDVGAVDARLEDEWLAVTAAVRPSLARLEAIQLEARVLGRMQPLEAWSNAPDDPWRKPVVAGNAAKRQAGDVTKLDLKRFVAAFGSSEAWQGSNVAVALIDQFTEAVPMAERSTYAAFGFNAPAARPPQAILLAVPPRSDRRLDAAGTLDILMETRELLRARAARPEDVVGHPVAPSMWFDGASPLRVRLDNGTQYWR
ncbi:hypothetical protein NKI39_22125 [Mesorhizobium sp. M0664]|uniref:hypothetical protein n=1 Tax=Mesorhizobium sp. M0664 TaxID=2956982 RepID=UPI00333DD3CF